MSNYTQKQSHNDDTDSNDITNETDSSYVKNEVWMSYLSTDELPMSVDLDLFSFWNSFDFSYLKDFCIDLLTVEPSVSHISSFIFPNSTITEKHKRLGKTKRKSLVVKSYLENPILL